MGCASSNLYSDPAAEQRNKEIERELEKDRLRERNSLKILLLGAGESGKSTVLKQLVILHKGGFPDEERLSYATIIWSNTIQSLHVLLDALPELSLTLLPRNVEAASYIQDLSPDDWIPTSIDRKVLMTLVADPAVQEAISHASELQLNNSAAYLFNNMDRTIRPDYLPNDDDILRARVRTTGITEHVIPMGSGKGKTLWRVFDVGGQRSERRKWIACFENVDVLLCLVAISEFDEVLYEDQTVSRIKESMMLFESLAASQWFLRSTMILFLNKIDLFRNKIERGVRLQDYFPEYNGPNDYENGVRFMAQKFQSLYRQTKPLYTHFTQATDTRGLEIVIKAVQDTIARNTVEFAL